MNTLSLNNKLYKFESYWRKSKKDNFKDKNNHLFPFPKEGKLWSDKLQFLNKLHLVEETLIKNNNFKFKESSKDCLLCDKKNIFNGIYILDNIIWQDSLTHYIDEHHIKPSDEFIEKIYKHKTTKENLQRTINFKSKTYQQEVIKYVKMNRNQLLILDALLSHGGYTKKYYEIDSNNKIMRYSEHAGLLDFDEEGLEKVIISGVTERMDDDDMDIYFPSNIPDLMNYEYYFHTHPPTPKPGGRASEGVLYEIPSIDDLLHFIYAYNKGLAQGSLVVSAEGLYNIRKKTLDMKNINVSRKNLANDYLETSKKIQKEYIRKYGTNFNTNKFYSKISQDTQFIEEINNILDKYEIRIDYFPRVKKNNKWVLDTIYLPVFVVEEI